MKDGGASATPNHCSKSDLVVTCSISSYHARLLDADSLTLPRYAPTTPSPSKFRVHIGISSRSNHLRIRNTYTSNENWKLTIRLSTSLRSRWDNIHLSKWTGAARVLLQIYSLIGEPRHVARSSSNRWQFQQDRWPIGKVLDLASNHKIVGLWNNSAGRRTTTTGDSCSSRLHKMDSARYSAHWICTRQWVY